MLCCACHLFFFSLKSLYEGEESNRSNLQILLVFTFTACWIYLCKLYIIEVELYLLRLFVCEFFEVVPFCNSIDLLKTLI